MYMFTPDQTSTVWCRYVIEKLQCRQIDFHFWFSEKRLQGLRFTHRKLSFRSVHIIPDTNAEK
ncbi:hypothetical protein AKJ16_DCAP08886 [Drosera capensis]